MRCTYYEKRARCEKDAEFLLFSPDGRAIPGGRYCQKHTDETILEYQEKLGQEWFAESIDDLGDLIPLTPIISARYIKHFRTRQEEKGAIMAWHTLTGD